MKRKRHTPEGIIRKLGEADAYLAAGPDVGQVCQKLGVSKAPSHRWCTQCGSMKAKEMKWLRELGKENARLKKIVADLELDKAILEAYIVQVE